MLDKSTYYLNAYNSFIRQDYYTWAQERAMLSMHIEDDSIRFAFERDWMGEYIRSDRVLPECTASNPTYCLNLRNPEVREAWESYKRAAKIPQMCFASETERRYFEACWMRDKLEEMEGKALDGKGSVLSFCGEMALGEPELASHPAEVESAGQSMGEVL